MKLKIFHAQSFVNKNFSSIASTISKKPQRPILQCVNMVIDFESMTLTMTATDSAILSKRIDRLTADNLENPEGYKKISINVPADDFLKTIKPLLPKKKDCPIEFEYDWDKDRNTVTVILDECMRIPVKLVPYDYPVTDQVTKDYDKRLTDFEKHRIVTLNTELLKKLISYAEKMGEDAVRFALPAEPGEHMKPVAFRIRQELGETFGIITPMRSYE